MNKIDSTVRADNASVFLIPIFVLTFFTSCFISNIGKGTYIAHDDESYLKSFKFQKDGTCSVTFKDEADMLSGVYQSKTEENIITLTLGDYFITVEIKNSVLIIIEHNIEQFKIATEYKEFRYK